MKNRLFLILLVSLFLVNCQTQNPKELTTTVITPLEKLNVKMQSFTVSNSIENNLTSAKGSTLTIKPNTFIDADGNVVEDEVQLEFREFHSIEDIIVAGIPMYHEQNGETGHLVTAGMCEIRGSANGKEVFINPDNPIKIDLISEYKGDGDVGFYVLDEANGKWQESGAPTPNPDPKAAAIETELAKINALPKPKEPRPFSSSEPALNFNVNGPTGSTVDKSLWRYAGDDLSENPLVRIEFETNLYKITSNRITDGENLRIESEFQLYKKDENDSLIKTEKIKVALEPVIFGKELEAARDNYNKAYLAYKEAIKRRGELLELAKGLSSSSNSFNVSNWGYFNCDVFSRNAFTQYNLQLTENNKDLDYDTKLVLFRESEKEPGILNIDYKKGGIDFNLFDEGICHILVFNGDEQIAVIKHIKNNDSVSFSADKIIMNIDEYIALNDKKDLSSVLASL